MMGWGVILILFGAGSFVLNLLGREFILLMWIDMWGPEVGVGIRVGIIAIGLALVIIGAITKKDPDPNANQK